MKEFIFSLSHSKPVAILQMDIDRIMKTTCSLLHIFSCGQLKHEGFFFYENSHLFKPNDAS